MRRLHFVSYVFAFGLLLCVAQSARAQDDVRRWEAGVHFSAFNVTNGDATVSGVNPCLVPPCPVTTTTTEQRRTETGFGARLGYSFNRYATAEAEVNYFPAERALTDPDFTGGRKLQGLFGVKVGRRYEHAGVFAKARPGFVTFAEGDMRVRQTPGTFCPAVFPPPLACAEATGRTDFAFDLGGVVELYPSSRAVIRFDFGDTILRTGEHLVPAVLPPSIAPQIPPSREVVVTSPRATTHNFQASVGIGFRF